MASSSSSQGASAGTSTSTSAANDAVQKLLKTSVSAVERGMGPAMDSAEQSQVALGAELRSLIDEMTRATEELGQVGVASEKRVMLAETRESLTRSKRKLSMINRRLVRLAKMDELNNHLHSKHDKAEAEASAEAENS